MKKSLLLFVVFCLLFSAMAVSAADPDCTSCGTSKCDPCVEECKFRVRYDIGDCLAVAPIDCDEHAYAEKVCVKFEPVQYKNGLIFYGWDWDGDNIVDFGYENNSFLMPMHDVTLKAICIPQWMPKASPCGPCGHWHHK